MGKLINKIPVVSQLKSAVQAISGDTEGARQTQEQFLKETPVVSQVTSAVQAISGDTEAARKTQEQFLENTLNNTPVVSQVISAGHAIAGNEEEAKRIQQQFLDQNILAIQETIASGFAFDWALRLAKLETSISLSSRTNWMARYQHKRIHEMLIPGTHDSTAYKFANLAGITAFAKTQQFSIFDQLSGGIRYIDIRVNGTRNDGEIYCSHEFFTIPFKQVLDDVNRFILSNPSEVIFFAVQGDGGGGLLPDAKTLAQSMLHGFTDSIQGTETIGELVSSRRNVVYIENHKCNKLEVVNSWDVKPPFQRTADSNPVAAVLKCIKFGEESSRIAGELVLQALQCTIAGDFTTVAGQITSLARGLEDLAAYSNHTILNVFLKKDRAVAGSNVINMDFANNQIIEEVIRLNG